MTEIDVRPAGQFCWAELGTTDLDKARPFYAELLGWGSKEEPAGEMGTYTMFTKGKFEVAGAYALSPEMIASGVPPHWTAYVQVDSADAAAAKAQELGATITVPPMDVMDVGRMAVFADPVGASIAVWQAKEHKGTSLCNEPGTPCWHEHMTKDSAKSAAFYTALFGWTTVEKPMQTEDGEFIYTIFQQGEQQVAGMMQMGAEFGETPSHWMIYLQVEDLDVAHRRIDELSGKTLIPPMPVPDVGRFMQVIDPTGAAVSLIEVTTPQS